VFTVTMEARRRGKLGWPVTAAVLIAAAVLYRLDVALIPFVLAIIVGFITDPLIRRLQTRTGWTRGAAAGVIYVAFLLVLVGVLYFVGLSVAKDVAQLLAHAPEILRYQIRRFVGAGGVDLLGRRTSADQLSQQILASAQKAFSFTTATRLVSGLVLTLAGFFLTLVLIAYIMVGAPRLTRGAVWLIPPQRRAGVERLLPKIVPVVQRYFIGLSVIVCCTFVLAWLGWGALLHLPHALLLSVAVALLETIPALGPFASGVLAGAASLQAYSLSAVGFTIAYVIALRLFVDNVVCPLVLGRATALSPVVVILALVVGGLMFGLPGFLLAVPAAATVRIVLKAIYEDQGGGGGRESQPAAEPEPPAG
jgi:predicted PurR-regulated permease PerM